MPSESHRVTATLLTIAIPTYNRAPYLRELLEVLLPQLQELQARGRQDEVELLISDNAATDQTPEVTSWAHASGVPLRLIRQPQNIGPDRNFAYCFQEARGRYFWLFGDDDILRPGGLEGVLTALRGEDYDLVFVRPFPFREDWRAEFHEDPWGRGAQVVRSAKEYARLVNIDATFITANIINRERLLSLRVESPEAFLDTKLIQLSWTLPLLRWHRQSVFLWQQYVAGRVMNSGGYNVAEVFGECFLGIVKRLLPDSPAVAAIFPNMALRRWFPGMLLELRQSGNTRYDVDGTERILHTLFKQNVRFWLFVWPILRLPLRAAKVWQRIFRMLGRIVDWCHEPAESLWKIRKIVSGSRSKAQAQNAK